MLKNYLSEIMFSRLALGIFVIVMFLITGIAKQSPASTFMTLATSKLKLPNGRVVAMEIADTPEERAQGLSGRVSLPESTAMLFVFSEEGYYSLWMANMRFAIDIIWLDSDYQVVDIAQYVQPLSNVASNQLPRYTNREPAQYVLEVNAGFSASNQLDRGDKIQLT
ncbi:hypothetical protein A2V68_02335 [candidate division Kazan bacterium RBG_13_50_9]|uniref:DUF192 domain-containing protein n=1 Tax=candidate division Kazan bacterium RBG_13_50_9 TaxID=1798535 RepID=A0A1F4NRP2_UNCK3|nr:MAG: hypothetical protein A2V68_02335 [candidate division Kazan bacterium RBG_13_50_9]